ncbi:hypothetical protein SBV1_1600026 [Verrucomicrobia bacterium]|nr:hypothetical protein SBV1_1600026 [Verrucomicrobiota bacterium]
MKNIQSSLSADLGGWPFFCFRFENEMARPARLDQVVVAHGKMPPPFERSLAVWTP